jgi:hypothetical protein
VPVFDDRVHPVNHNFSIWLVRASIALTRVEAMRSKIKAGGHANPYRLRKQLPEPVFGQLKTGARLPPVPAARDRQSACRVGHRLHCHNVLKLAQRWSLSAELPMAAGTSRGA